MSVTMTIQNDDDNHRDDYNDSDDDNDDSIDDGDYFLLYLSCIDKR